MNEQITFIKDPILNKIYHNDPVIHIQVKEFDESLLYFGSLITILENKKINQTMLMCLLLEHKEYLECFKTISGIENEKILYFNLLQRFPILSKSKIVKNKIREIHGKDAI